MKVNEEVVGPVHTNATCRYVGICEIWSAGGALKVHEGGIVQSNSPTAMDLTVILYLNNSPYQSDFATFGSDVTLNSSGWGSSGKFNFHKCDDRNACSFQIWHDRLLISQSPPCFQSHSGQRNNGPQSDDISSLGKLATWAHFFDFFISPWNIYETWINVCGSSGISGRMVYIDVILDLLKCYH